MSDFLLCPATAKPQMSHPQALVPACQECLSIAKKHYFEDIWHCRDQIKRTLRQKYAKHLAIGENWTQEELADSGFDDNIFGGFKKSAWQMFEIARDRVNAQGWPVVIDGIDYPPPLSMAFSFNGVEYSHISEAISEQTQRHALDESFLISLVDIVGKPRFAYAIRLAKLYRGVSLQQKKQLIDELQSDFQS
ncbi:hypothetical protein FJQ87_08920 [Shewanella sp. SNU WT4]|uniref:hypothetical protein n=1 Tax=Shewanella sp. SNU WT4 TaxID=2590015 RepID=UPI0011272A6D|nr:hypothetical protein [Shewanella sp. SNU WT4]QDF66816.1 hypothetical protein FJQ87_08920 [Shewanella sp. SNU WT4]